IESLPALRQLVPWSKEEVSVRNLVPSPYRPSTCLTKMSPFRWNANRLPSGERLGGPSMPGSLVRRTNFSSGLRFVRMTNPAKLKARITEATATGIFHPSDQNADRAAVSAGSLSICSLRLFHQASNSGL